MGLALVHMTMTTITMTTATITLTIAMTPTAKRMRDRKTGPRLPPRGERRREREGAEGSFESDNYSSKGDGGGRWR